MEEYFLTNEGLVSSTSIANTHGCEKFYSASEVDARIAELEKALRPFALAHGHAVAYLQVVGLSKPMDRRDLFMWQAGRPLCVDDYVAAAKAYGGQTMFGL